RSSVSCPTVRPAYSAATSECALAATFASSATSSFLLARLSGIAFSEPDSSAHPRGEPKRKTDHWLLADPPAPCDAKRGGRIDQPKWSSLRATPSAQAEGSR